MFLEEITPLLAGTVPAGSDGGICDMSESPLELVVSEKLNALMEKTANATLGYILLWLCDEAPVPETGKIHTIRAMPDNAPTANEWSHTPLTFSQTLPAGDYAVMGMSWVDATGIAARLMVPAYPWRPACLASTIGSGERTSLFRKGRWGRWLEFDFDNPPSVELLNTGVTKGEIYLDLMQISERRT